MLDLGRRATPRRRTAALTALLVLLCLSIAVRPQPASTSSNTSAPTPTPATNDDCSACCAPFSASGNTQLTNQTSLSCCAPGDNRTINLYGASKGYCVGLPCCTYSGRRSQGRRAWFPCLLFPTCGNDPTKKDFCENAQAWNLQQGASFSCTDACCSGPLLESNVWTGLRNAVPGQSNASFSILFNPSEFKRSFFDVAVRDKRPLQQIVLASPPEYSFGKRTRCQLAKPATNASEPATCAVSTMNGTTHLTVTIPEAYGDGTNETFSISFDAVSTPSGVVPINTTLYSTESNLVPLYFLFNDDGGFVYNTFYRLTPLTSASLQSGAFVPENIYPGNSGRAVLTFYSTTRVPSGSALEIAFSSKWSFPSDASWTWAVTPQDKIRQQLRSSSSPAYDDDDDTDDSSGSSEGAVEVGTVVDAGEAVFQPVASAKHSTRTNTWTLTIDEAWPVGWVTLVVDQVQNPAVYYSGLNLASLTLLDPQARVISTGVVSAISVELVSAPVASPYNYVTIVVLVTTLLFCTIVIRRHGLAFRLGSLWTDLTAIGTVLALATAIVNNLLWAMLKSSVYFYLARLCLCLTFTMLTAVCFHWGTVLSLHLRRWPPLKTVLLFVAINLAFYTFQAVLLAFHAKLISRVYATESDAYSYANQQCKDSTSSDDNSVFSDIQGYLWRCYAASEDEFFLVSTTVTSALFLGLNVVVMALGLLVMRRGKHLLGTSTGPHQVALGKALRLYVTLIGVVTAVYLLAWIVQLVSRGRRAIAYPWFYLFTVWLPQSIPPCCLIFLQWNAQSLQDNDRRGMDPSSVETASYYDENDEAYDEMHTPNYAAARWSDLDADYGESGGEEGEEDEDDGDECDSEDGEDGEDDGAAFVDLGGVARPGRESDWVGLSMSLETNEAAPRGCFVAIQRLQVDPFTGAHVWRQLSNTDTVEASRQGPLPSSPLDRRHVYAFMAVPRIPLTGGAVDDRVRLVVYAVNDSLSHHAHDNDHSEMTAAAVLAAMDHDSISSPATTTTTTRSFDEEEGDQLLLLHKQASSRVIDELFEDESEPDTTHADEQPSLSIVAEFTVAIDALVAAGARGELLTLLAAAHSYKQVGGLSSPPPPPSLSVHTVLPKAARAKYGLASLLSPTHATSSQYHLRELGLLVVEDLTESRFSNAMPRQLVEILLRLRSRQLRVALRDLARLEAFDRQRHKGTDRGIYENLIQQIQDDGDISRCRDWMRVRCVRLREYVALLRSLRRVYVARDKKRVYFKASTEKKNALLRFLPVNLHLQEMWVGSATASFHSDDEASAAASVYDIVTVGAMAAHGYKFKHGGLLALEEQRVKQGRGGGAERRGGARQKHPLWSESEQKSEDMDWELQQRMDVCFAQAVAALVTAFTRKVDLALQSGAEAAGRAMLAQLEAVGFLFDVESLVSTHGNEAGMLEDMAAAVRELAHVQFVLVDESGEAERGADERVVLDVDDESKESCDEGGSGGAATTAGGAAPLAGVVDVNLFTSLERALHDQHPPRNNDNTTSGNMLATPSPRSSSTSSLGNRLLRSFIRARSGLLPSSSSSTRSPSSSSPGLYSYTSLVVRVKVRTARVQLPPQLANGATVRVTPVLFTQGINEKQTLANNTGHAATRRQDAINDASLALLRGFVDRYAAYHQSISGSTGSGVSGSGASGSGVSGSGVSGSGVSGSGVAMAELKPRMEQLAALLAQAKQARKKRPEILQLSSDLCRELGGGRVTVCKSAKDRTGMAVTLEQGRVLVAHHGLPEAKKPGIVAVMRAEGVRIENALKNTGRRVFAFNALQRSLLPEEYRCPPQTAGKNVS